MTTLTIEIPDNVTEDVVKYLKEKAVVIKDTPFKTLDELTADDYRNNFKERAKMTRAVALKYL
jgi:hypothetical protein